MDKMFVALFCILMTGCANIQLCNIHPEWNPPQGYDWAVAQCEAKKSSAYSPNAFDEAFKKNEIFNACMKSYGYEMRRIVQASPEIDSIKKDQVIPKSLKDPETN